MSNANKTILITGGFGYVGSRLTPKLLAEGYRVKVLDLCLYGEHGLQEIEKQTPDLLKNLDWTRGDLRDPNAIDKAVSGVDTVIHLAAISNDPTGDIDEVLTRQVNFDAVGLLVMKAKSAGVKRFINASSSSVFGARTESEINELLEPAPITYYSKYKMLSEWIINGASSRDFVTVNVRPATICGYSPRQRFDLTVNKLTADAVMKRVITVHGGSQRRPNIGMEDMVNLYSQLIQENAEKINGRTFNFGFENLKVIEIAQLIQSQLSDLNVKINVTETQDLRDYHITSKKILETLGYKSVSSIKAEVNALRAKLEAGYYGKNIDDDRFYNMKAMKIGRDASVYQSLAK